MLRQCGPALHEFATARIDRGGAHQPDRVDAEMMAKTAVLDGNEGIANIGGKIAHRDGCPLNQTTARDHAALDVQQCDVITRLIGEEMVGAQESVATAMIASHTVPTIRVARRRVFGRFPPGGKCRRTFNLIGAGAASGSPCSPGSGL